MPTSKTSDVRKLSARLDRRAFLVGAFAATVGAFEPARAASVVERSPFGGFKSAPQGETRETTRGVFTFQTEFDVSEIASELAALDELEKELTRTLSVPAPREKICARIFADEESWRAFFKRNFSSISYRRAMFDRKNYLFDAQKSRLYAFRGPMLGVDLLHEGTHALLSSSLKRSVPIWLDEGLAEYFEATPDSARRENPAWLSTALARLENGAFCPLERLERVPDAESATRAFYCDSWAWTNYLLNDSPKTRGVVSAYLNDLARSRPFSPKVSARLKKIGGGEDALRRYFRRFA